MPIVKPVEFCWTVRCHPQTVRCHCLLAVDGSDLVEIASDWWGLLLNWLITARLDGIAKVSVCHCRRL